MVGRKPKNDNRSLTVKNIYLPDDVQSKVVEIATSVTTSAMELYVQSVKSYIALNYNEYMAWMKADWRTIGIPWPEYVIWMSDGRKMSPVTVSHRPSGLAGVSPITPSTPPITINTMILPEITILLVRAAARREGMSINKVISQMIKWHVDRYWETNYVRLMVDHTQPEFIAGAEEWSCDKVA